MLILAILEFSLSAHGQVSGSEAAIHLINKMFETLGGKEVWQRARTIEVRLKGYHAGEKNLWKEHYWIDLEEPGGRYEITKGDTMHTIAWSASGGWEMKNGIFTKSSAEKVAFEQSYWTKEPYVVLHRLASTTRKSRVALDSLNDRPQRFYVLNEESDTLCWYAVNANFEPVKWGTKVNEELVIEHVLGPLHDYGEFKSPYWGATISGFWRYIHEYVKLSPTSPPVSFRHSKE